MSHTIGNFSLSWSSLTSPTPWSMDCSPDRVLKTSVMISKAHQYMAHMNEVIGSVCKCWSIFTVRNSSCGNVMFLHLSVILFTGGLSASGSGGVVCLWVHGGCTPPRQTSPPADTPLDRLPPPGRHLPPPPQDGHCSGRYAFYWNAFLLVALFNQIIPIMKWGSPCNISTYSNESILEAIVKYISYLLKSKRTVESYSYITLTRATFTVAGDGSRIPQMRREPIIWSNFPKNCIKVTKRLG